MGELTRNRELFEKIAAHIEETPHRYDQDQWFETINPKETETLENVDLCSTTMCIAGWAVFLIDGIEWFYEDGHERWFEGEITDHAAGLLGIDGDEAEALFDCSWMEDADVGEVADALRDIGNGSRIKEMA